MAAGEETARQRATQSAVETNKRRRRRRRTSAALEKTVEVIWHVSGSPADAHRAAAKAAGILSGEPADQDDRPEALAAGRSRQSLAQRSVPISYRDVGRLLESPLGVFDPRVGVSGRTGER